MPIFRRRARPVAVSTTTRTRRPTLMQRLRGRHAVKTTAVPSTTTTTRRHGRHGLRSQRPVAVAPVRQRRKTTIGDKVSGAWMKVKGSIRGHPGEKAAGTRRMHGTDGRGQRRRRYY